MTKTRVALVSFTSQFGKPEDNLRSIIKNVECAAKEKASLVCFPEIALQGYHTDIRLMREQAEDCDGPICQKLIETARQNQIVISLGMALSVNGRVFNAQVYLGPMGILGYSPKVHLAPEEANCYTAGDNWPVIDLGFAKVGTLICFDAQFPEAARCLALGGADVLLMSFATGRCDPCGRPQSPDAWANHVLAWAPSRACDNRVFVLGVNHAGDVFDDGKVAGASWVKPGELHQWPGYSFAVGPTGTLLAESSRSHNRERMLVVELDPGLRDHWRLGIGNLLNYRRPETYRQLLASPSRAEP